MIERSGRVIAVLNGPDVDSGTAWEIGYACARDKELLGIHEDDRGNKLNLMISSCLQVVHSFTELRQVLSLINRTLPETGPESSPQISG